MKNFLANINLIISIVGFICIVGWSIYVTIIWWDVPMTYAQQFQANWKYGTLTLIWVIVVNVLNWIIKKK